MASPRGRVVSTAPMPRTTPTNNLVAFKVDAELAAVLDAMPNKSEFIRAAIEARLGTVCPTCGGTGVRPHPKKRR